MPKDSAAHSGPGHLASINNENHPSQTCPQTNLIKIITQLRHLSEILDCIKLTVKASQDTHVPVQ